MAWIARDKISPHLRPDITGCSPEESKVRIVNIGVHS
jgi:hypothetical protein